MDKKKIIGYAMAAVGLFGLAYGTFGSQMNLPITFPAFVAGKYLMVGSLILVIFGVIFVSQGSKAKQPEEVPIYHGHGKERRIIGYQKISAIL